MNYFKHVFAHFFYHIPILFFQKFLFFFTLYKDASIKTSKLCRQKFKQYTKKQGKEQLLKNRKRV